MVDVQHSLQSGAELHVDRAIKLAVRAASTANVTLATPGAAIDGVSMVAGDRMLLKNQTAPAENGIYVWNGAAVPATRATDATLAADFVYGFLVFVREGTANAATYWRFMQTAALTIGTTALTFAQAATDPTTTRGDLIARGATSLGRIAVGLVGKFLGTNGTDPLWTNSAEHFAATGLTGAVSASRYAGATAGGPPVAGTFVTGDAVFDLAGKQWICTAGGTPGTWDQSNRVVSGGLNGQGMAIASLTELLTIAAAATSTTTIQIPAGAIVLAVNVRVTVAIPTAATFTVIGNTSTTVFNTAAVAVALNTTDKGTAAGAYYNAAAQTIRITPNLTPATNVGRVRVTIFYLDSIPPTS